MIRQRSKTKGVPRIPSAWFALLPGQTLAFWLRVERERKKKGLAKSRHAAIAALALALHTTTNKEKNK